MDNQTLTVDMLKGYLGTGLKVETPSGIVKMKGLNTTESGGLGLCYYLINGVQGISWAIDCKPYLRNLSSLTKPITVEGYSGGEPFVPVDEISKKIVNEGFLKTIIYYLENYPLMVVRLNHLPTFVTDILYKWHFAINIPESLYIKIQD